MKIALIILQADAARGGAERYTVDLAAALAGRGHEVTLLGGDRQCRQTRELAVAQGYRQVVLPLRGITRSAKYRGFAAAAQSWLAAHPHPIVHAMLPLRGCNIYHPHAGLAINALLGKPVQTLFNPRRRLFARIERELLTRRDPPRVLCLSELVKGEMRRSYPDFPAGRLEVLFNAVDLTRYAPPAAGHPQSAAPVEALLVAQSFKLKGVATAIRALVDAPDITLTVIGRDPPTEYWKLAEELGVTDRLAFPGVQSDMARFYRRAGFLVLPTRRDSCSLVVLEALACGLPVISTRHNGACEIMRDGQHGYILDEADDSQALAQAMNRLANGDLRAKMQAACTQLRPLLGLDRHLQSLEAIYRRTPTP